MVTAHPPNPTSVRPAAAPGALQRRRWRCGPRTGVLLGALALAGTEGLLRLTTDLDQQLLTECSARLGWRTLPHQRVVDPRTGVSYRANDFGFRDDDFGRGADGLPLAVDDSSAHLVVLGNSISFGEHVAEEQSWPAVLEAQLAAQADPAAPVEVWNLAQRGYCLEQQVLLARDLVLPLRPDVLLLALNSYDVRPMRPEYDPPHYPLRELLVRTTSYQFLNQIVLEQRRELGQRAVAAAGPEALEEWNATQRAVREDPNAEELLWLRERAEESVAELARECAAAGTRLVLVTLPEEQRRRAATTRARWRHFAATHPGVQWIEAGAGLDLRGGDEAAWLEHDPQHLSPHGHRRVAETVAAGLASAGGRAP
jgi:lysophospholipase L1-like esterase